MPEKVLLVGNNVRNVAESAKKAGYDVYAITKFADADLEVYCEKVYEVNTETPDDTVSKLAKMVAEEVNAKVVLCSGYEALNVRTNLLCSDPKECKKVVDKLKFYKTLEKNGIPHPEVLNKPEGEFIVKPRFGGGGEDTFLQGEVRDGFIVQKYIEGIPCSISLICYENFAIPIAANLIIVGWKEMNASDFRYAGNITPLDVSSDKISELERTAVETVELFDLIGSVGVDFILADKPYVLEVNPRFQGSLDSIEWSLDVNLFSLHVMAFENKKFERCKPKRWATRTVLFADRETKIKRSLVGNPFYADIPKVGTIYNKFDPITSILSSGNSKGDVLRRVIERKRAFLTLACR